MISAPVHLSRDADDVLDDPRRWHPAMKRPFFDSIDFQKQLDSITGKQILRLSWAPEVVSWNPRAVGETPMEEFRPQHVALHDRENNPVAPPRWLIEERLEPESYYETWERDRWFRDPRDELLYDLRGPAPREGSWRFLLWVNEHDTNCCELRLRNQLICWGYYKEPGQKELKEVRERWLRLQADREVNPLVRPELLADGQPERDLASEMRNERRARKESAVKFWHDKLKTQKLDIPTLQAFVTQGLMKNSVTHSIPAIHAEAAKKAEERLHESNG